MNTRNFKFALTVIMTVIAGNIFGQGFNSSYFNEGVTSRHEMNAAFEGEYNYVAIPILGSLNIKKQGNFGLQDVLFKNPETGYYNRTFMHPDVSTDEALSGFSSGANKMLADANIALISAGFKSFGGYNIIELKSKSSVGLSVPYELLEFAKNTSNKSYEFDNISTKAFSYVELALGHSRQFTEKLRLGTKLKFLFGLANADLQIENMRADLSGDQWLITSDKAEANVNIKRIQFKNTTSNYEYRSGSYEHVDLGETEIDGFGIGGFGLGLDLGAEYHILDGLKVSAAINDLGFISWNNNYLLRQRERTFRFNGFHDVAVKSEKTNKGDILDDQFDDYSDQLSDFASLNNEGDTGGKTTALAATINLGGEYTLPSYNELSFGLLAQQRINGKFSWTEGRLSANWGPLSWLNGGANIAVSTLAVSAGWILNIHPKGFNFFVGMDHILGKTSKEFIPLKSNASISLGMSITWGGSKKEKDNNSKQLRTVYDENIFDI